jgi:TM2 domain-containing membrane protein YozV
MSNAESTNTTTKKHPIRGFLYGIFFGLGLALIAVGQGWAALGTRPPIVILVVGIIIGTLWSMFGPAKGPKGAPSANATVDPDPEPEPAEESAVDEEAALES